MSQLLVEYFPLTLSTSLLESIGKNPNAPIILEGVMQRADAPNQNGRRYPRAILEREMQKYNQLIKERRALGELDHPDSTVINLKNVAINVTELYWRGNDLCGKIEVLTTPSGNIARELIKNKITLGISSRGTGSVREGQDDGVDVVQEDFSLLCWDLVSDPSTHQAFMRPTVSENKQTSLKMIMGTDKKKAVAEDKWARANDLIIDILNEVK